MWTAFYYTPCLIPSCPACEPNSGSVFSSLSTKAHSSRGGRHCYAIKWNRAKSRCLVRNSFQIAPDSLPIWDSGSADETMPPCRAYSWLSVLSFRREETFRETAVARLETIC